MKIDKKIIVNALIALVVYAAVMGLVKGGVLSRQMMSLITPVCVYVMMSVSLSLVVGFLGELSLGHAAFMSIGAYTGCLFLIATKDILPVLVSLLLAVFIGGVAAALLGVIIGIPVLRLKGDYLAIVTLGFGEIIKSILKPHWRKGIWFSGIGIVLAVIALFIVAGFNNTAFYPSYTDLNSSLTIHNASSSLYTLKTMAYVSLASPIVLAYIFYAWRALNKKQIDIQDVKDDHHAY